MIDYYETQRRRYSAGEISYEEAVQTNSPRIKWGDSVRRHLKNDVVAEFAAENIRISHYRPFALQYLYCDRMWLGSISKILSMYPFATHPTQILAVARHLRHRGRNFRRRLRTLHLPTYQ